MTSGWIVDPKRLLRRPGWDALAVSLAMAHGAALVTAPSAPLIAIGMWWNANTIAHHFIHLPFFRSRVLNQCYSAYSSLLLGLPQTLWRRRHLVHHFPRCRSGATGNGLPRALWIEGGLVVALWSLMLAIDLRFFLDTYLPGWAVGLALCHVHGYFEHAHGTTSHYGRLYNLLFFRDGYHIEHHERPGAHWSELRPRAATDRGASTSRWPPVLRWLDVVSLTGLERLVLGRPWLQRLVIGAHARAFRKLLPRVGTIDRALVVGGGLFPRTPLVLRTLLPQTHVTVLDADADHLDSARQLIGDDSVAWKVGTYDPTATIDAELLVVPLAFVGDRAILYRLPPARYVVIHDWIWRPRGETVVVAWWLLKRLNLVRRANECGHARSPAA